MQEFSSSPRIAKVKVAGKEALVPLAISSIKKPEIPGETIVKWQDIADLLADTIDFPTALINRISENYVEVFLSARTKENIFEENETIGTGTGIFCETVMGTNSLLKVENAKKKKKWQHLQNTVINMSSYIGSPICWPDGEFFGTICALHHSKTRFSELHVRLITHLRDNIEQDLHLILLNEQVKYFENKSRLIKEEFRSRLNRTMLELRTRMSVIASDHHQLAKNELEIKNAEDLIIKMHQYHEKLVYPNTETGIKLIGHLNEVVELFVSFFNFRPGYTVSGNEVVVSTETATNLGLLINELLYATFRKTGNEGNIQVNLTVKFKEPLIKLTYSCINNGENNGVFLDRVFDEYPLALALLEHINNGVFYHDNNSLMVECDINRFKMKM